MTSRLATSALGAVLALVAAPAADAAFTAPMAVGAGAVAQPAIGQSPFGDGVVGWRTSGRFTVAVHDLGAAGWVATALSTPGRTVGDGDVASDRWGGAVAVWSETLGATTTVKVASHIRGGAWSAPLTVASGSDIDPDVVLTPLAITPHAAWVQGGTVREAKGYASSVVPARWDPAQEVPGSAGAAGLAGATPTRWCRAAWT